MVATVLGNGETVLVPHYDLIHQTGLDLQYTKEALLVKLEAISRSGHGKRFYAAIGGVEYTLFQIFESKSDLGLVAEYQYEGRVGAPAPGTINDSDIFIGARWTLNDEKDTALLAGVIMDVRSGTRLFSVEAERRLTDTMKLELEGRFSFNVSASDAASAFRDDDQVTLRLKYFY